jgi:hypothetical protein
MSYPDPVKEQVSDYLPPKDFKLNALKRNTTACDKMRKIGERNEYGQAN